MATREIGTEQNLTGTAETSDEYEIWHRGTGVGFKHGFKVVFNDVGDGNIAIQWNPDGGDDWIAITDLDAITADKIDNIEPVSFSGGKVRFVLSTGTTADIDVCVY